MQRIEPGPWIPISVPWRSAGRWRDINIWLLDNVGHGSYHFMGFDITCKTNRIVEFVSEKDAMMFSLRWA